MTGLRRATRTAFAALVAAAVLVGISGPAAAASRHGGAGIEHRAIKYFVPGKRIRLAAEVRNVSGLSEVRCYFRAVGHGDYVHAVMRESEKGGYTVVLPAPVATTTAIQYRIEAHGRRGVVARTKTIFVERRDTDETPLWQDLAADEAGRIGGAETAAPDGFSDGRTVDPGTETQAPPPKTAPAQAAAAKSAGLSTTTLLGIGAGVAVVGGGVALAVAGGSGEDSNAEPCNQTVRQGGDAPEEHTISLGKKSGTFGFAWNMYGIRDRMRLVYDGGTIFDTGCYTGAGYQSVPFSGSSKTVRVVVSPNCQGGTGTSWEFRIDCP